MKPKLLSLLLAAFFLFQHTVHADTFIVTTNAFTGQGSLSEAIQNASLNGTSTTDFIVFNLPGNTTADRTILLNSTLNLTSNLVIDGTSQPGPVFGISDTKIIIERQSPLCFGLYLQDTRDIAIYGIWFKNFAYIDNLTDVCHGATIMMNGVKNMTIGAPGKGNAFSSNNTMTIFHKSYYGIDYIHPTVIADTVNIENNLFGLSSDALFIDNNCKEGISIGNGRNVTINNNKGNGGFSVGSAYEENNGFIKFTNNTLNNPPSGTLKGAGSFAVSINGFTTQYVSYDLTIRNNKITNPYQYCIILWDMRGSIVIDQNTIGEYYDLKNEPDQYFGIGMIRCVTANATRITNNTIMNRKNGVWATTCDNIYISNNSIFCTSKGLLLEHPVNPIPVVSIKNITSSIAGIATPNTKVEIFYTDTCTQLCENGKFFLGNTFADAAGNFSFPISTPGLFSATATTADSITSEFNGVKVDTIYATIKNATCGQNNGSITGIAILNASSWRWENELGQIISSTDTNLYNLPPGRYRLILHEANVSCDVMTRFFEVLSYPQPVLPGNPFQLTQPSCGLNNGKIIFNGTRPPGAGNAWLNASNTVLQYNTDELNNVPAGSYYFKLYLYEDTLCYTTYGPFALTNQSGPSLTVSNVTITSATCNNSNGSITNITASNVNGSTFIQWTDSLNNVVGNTFDLLNQPAGKYKLKFKDQSGCDTIITPFYIIPGTGKITIDTTGKLITKAGCTVNNGSIRNIKVTGADTYQWQNLTTNTPAGNTIDIYNLSPCNYQLTATNAIGCSAISPIINVPQSVFIPIGVTGTQTRIAVCGENNGMIRITSFNNDSNLYSFRWIDSASNQVLSTGTALYNIGAGTYLLIAIDSNGCEKQITKSILGAWPKPVFDMSAMQIKNDICSRGEGSITGIKTTGFPPQLPLTYTWKNASNNVVGTSQDLLAIPAGQYYLTVSDGILCSIQSSTFTVSNADDPGIVLQYDDQTIPRNTSATMTIKNFRPGNYFLYSDAAATQLLQQNTTGNFSTGVLTADADYYIKFVSGTCSASLKHVKITVVDKSYFAIASAFTPNNDGMNDNLQLTVIGYIDVEYFKIFNRNGEQVFFTKTIHDGWDGRYKGIEQPSAAFVWMARGKDIHGNVITGKGTFVLIR